MFIKIFAFLLFAQSIVACQQVSENAQPMAADLGFQANLPSQKIPEKNQTSATNLVFQSTDGGQTWQDISAGLPENLEVNCVFANEHEVFLGVGKGVYRSSNDQAGLALDLDRFGKPSVYRSSTDLAAPKWEKALFLDEEISDISAGRSGVFARGSRSGILQNIGQTDIWKPVFTDLKDKMMRTILETPDGTVFVGTDSGIFKSTDSGKTWKQVFNECAVFNLVESDGILVGGGFRGIMRSTDGGENWEWVIEENGVGTETAQIEGGFAEINYNGKVRRMRISTDGGKTWQAIDEGLPPSDMISNIKQVGGVFFCSHPKGIFRSSDQGKTWELLLPATGKKQYNLTVSGLKIFATLVFAGC